MQFLFAFIRSLFAGIPARVRDYTYAGVVLIATTFIALSLYQGKIGWDQVVAGVAALIGAMAKTHTPKRR